MLTPNEKLKTALGEKFQFKIVNGTGSTKTVAIFPANFRTQAVVSTFTGTLEALTGNAQNYTPAGTIANTINYASAAKITAAGYSGIDYALDDGILDATSSDLVVTAANSQFTVRHFLDFIKQNPQTLKKMTIQGSDASVFNQIINFAYVGPLADYGRDFLNLQDYFSENQTSQTKITLPDLNLAIDDTLLMWMAIEDGKTVTITFNF